LIKELLIHCQGVTDAQRLNRPLPFESLNAGKIYIAGINIKYFRGIVGLSYFGAAGRGEIHQLSVIAR
jgi:hypothetical protein